MYLELKTHLLDVHVSVCVSTLMTRRGINTNSLTARECVRDKMMMMIIVVDVFRGSWEAAVKRFISCERFQSLRVNKAT